ncbi:MAG: hypothetical protein LBS25_01265 [Candidatus Symbiothrix sp.]|jgi:hypothetical protein|nr:hypothetical protein [Candidatus Symbiothrix sp.]
MKELNLNACDVEEMNHQEMGKIDGGLIGAWGWFWSGCKIGLIVGASAATAALLCS